ncbi:MAG: polysaccharide biosynthesis C-terminal domain-containing protein [Bacteroidales bacterium]
MLKSIKTSFKDTVIYGLGNVAVKIVGLILIPLYTDPKFFSTDQFGVLGILEISALVLTSMLASGLPQSLTRWFWDKEYKDNQKGIFFMSFSTQVIVSLIFCLTLIPVSRSLSMVLFSKPDWARVITLVILASAIQSVNNVINTLMRLQSRSVLYSVTNLFKLVSVLSLTLYFILSKKMGLEGIYLAQAIGNGIVVLLLLGYTLKNSRVFFDKIIFKSMNAYGFPLLLANISAALFTVIDRFSLTSLTVLKSVALYNLAFKISSVLKLVLADSMKLALGPMMIKRMDSPDNKRFYSKVLLYSSYALMIGIVGISLFSFEIVKVIATSRAYWDAVVIIPVLSMSIFFANMKEVTVYGLHIAKKTRIIGIIVVFSTVLSLVLNFLLIPVWDITGAAVATLLSQFIYWYACYYYSQKVFYVPYEIGKLTLMVITGAVLSFSGLLLNGLDLLPRMIIKTLCLVSFPFILYLFNFYEPVELQSIRGFINKWSKIKNLKSNLNSLKGITDEL